MELFNVVVFGLLVGSFLNVVIYRLPLMEMRDYELGIAEYTGDASVVKTPLTSLC
ncbi:prepilin peptidase, partial [Vibrio sp. 10N.222.49.C9]